MSAAGDLRELVAFREALVAYINAVEGAHGSWSPGLSEEQARLTREYGRLYRVIVARGGIAQMGAPAFGVMSRDVVADAIGRPDHFDYDTVARFATQHVDTVIGRIQDEVERRADPDRVYRLTSPLFWVSALARSMVQLLATTRGRILAAVGAIILVIIGGVASGWAQAFFSRVPSGP